MKRFCVVLAVLGLALHAPAAEEQPYPWLETLDPDEGVKASGKLLVGLPYGINALEQNAEADITRLLVGVHGWRSEGYEWVYPLQTMDSEITDVYFFNWDTSANRCVNDVAIEINEKIDALLNDRPQVDTVTIVGHSLGGVVVALIADLWTAEVALDIHTVAAPLAALSENNDESCPRELPQNESAKVRFFQWRTQFELDNAFNRMDTNPMDVEINNSVVLTLPDTYRDRRLGHNWSLSYVAERVATQKHRRPLPDTHHHHGHEHEDHQDHHDHLDEDHHDH